MGIGSIIDLTGEARPRNVSDGFGNNRRKWHVWELGRKPNDDELRGHDVWIDGRA